MPNKPSLEQINPAFGSSFLVRQYNQSCENTLANWHFHPEVELIYVKGGTGKRHIGRHMSYFNDGDLVLMGANLPHYGFTDRLTGNSSETVVQFRQDFLGDTFFEIPEMNGIKKLLELSKKGLAFHGGTKEEVKTDITLKSGNGRVFYRETVKGGENYAKRLDMSEMPNGEYTLEIENKNSFTAIPVKLELNTAVVNSKDEVTIVKPTLNVVGDKLNVAFADQNTEEVWVSIFDNNSNRLAYEKISTENRKRFDLSRLEKGDYTVLMFTKGKKFIQSVSLEK
jgi:hypothetical protein